MSTATLTHLFERLEVLRVERALAIDAGLGDNPTYMRDLESEIAEIGAAWVGGAVTEIATLRAQLGGAGWG